MSLNVSEALIQQATAGDVDEPAFVETIRQSLRDCLDSAAYRNFTSIRNQILNQTPELQDC